MFIKGFHAEWMSDNDGSEVPGWHDTRFGTALVSVADSAEDSRSVQVQRRPVCKCRPDDAAEYKIRCID